MWQSYFEMMHVVPNCASPEPFFSPINFPESPNLKSDFEFEFDLDLLPSSNCSDVVPGFDLPLPLPSDPFQEVPSPSSSFCLQDSSLSSPTMFSPPHGCEKHQVYTSYITDHHNLSPVSLPPSSPYSPAGRPNRLSSTDSGRMTDCGSSASSVQDSVLELNELRARIGSGHKQPPPPYGAHQASVVPKIESEQQILDANPLLRQALQSSEQPGGFRPEVKTELEEVKMNPLLSLAMEAVQKEVDTTCQTLNIARDPSQWSRVETSRWLEWTLQHFSITPYRPIHDWAEEGAKMIYYSREKFRELCPEGGDLLFDQLDVWKISASPQDQQTQQEGSSQYDSRLDMIDLISIMGSSEDQGPSFNSASSHPEPGPSFSAQTMHSPCYTSASVSTQSFLSQPIASPSFSTSSMVMMSPPPAYPGTPVAEMSTPNEDFLMGDDDEDETTERETNLPALASPSASTPHRTSSNIHLWQFVKELLNEPHLYSGCIHWVDKSNGIFKIVDSVRVAQLWGKRKNRPAMNYDKLSRSLRQYYKKGIMKKTEKTQRLVYQFCSPYHL